MHICLLHRTVTKVVLKQIINWYLNNLDEIEHDIVNIGLHFILKNVRPYAASCSEA